MIWSLWALHSQKCCGERDWPKGQWSTLKIMPVKTVSSILFFPLRIICCFFFFFDTSSKGWRCLGSITPFVNVLWIKEMLFDILYQGKGTDRYQQASQLWVARPKRKRKEDAGTFYTVTRREWQSGTLSHHVWICEGTLRYNQGVRRTLQLWIASE